MTASGDKTARIWDAETYQQIAVLKGHEDAVSSAEFSPDGKRIVTASGDKTARIWDAETYQQIAVLKGHEDAVSSAAFSPDGKRIVTASADTAKIWDAKTYAAISALSGDNCEIMSAAFSPDGKRLVTVSCDMAARIWDAETLAQVATLERGPGWQMQDGQFAAFSPDGKRVVATATFSSNAAGIWFVFPTTESLIEYSKRAVPRCLTRNQREEGFLDPQPPVWCIEMKKPPYNTTAWSLWLVDKTAGKNPPLPPEPPTNK